MIQTEPAIRIGEWLTIAAVFFGPLLALQAQKLLEGTQGSATPKTEFFVL